MERLILRGPQQIIAVLLIGLGGILAGCGGTSSDQISKEDFLEQGNAICVKRLKEKDVAVRQGLAKLPPTKGGKSAEQIEGLFMEAVLEPYDALVQELRELPPPDEDAEAAEQVITKFEAGLVRAKRDPHQAIEAGSFKEANEAAGSYGLHSCIL